MSTLLDECRAAAPAWMAAEGAWLRGVSADQREWMRWERAVWEHAQSGRGWCAEIAVERNAAGWCRVAGVYMPPAPPADADEGIGPEAQGPDLRRALAFVAAEVRAEMVARGLAEAEPKAPGPVCACCTARGCACVAHLPRIVTRYDDAGLSVTSDTPGVPR